PVSHASMNSRLPTTSIIYIRITEFRLRSIDPRLQQKQQLPRREDAKPELTLHRLRTLPRKSGHRHRRPETRAQKRRRAKPQPKERLQRNRQEKVLLRQASEARLIKKSRRGSPQPLQCHRGVEPEPAGKGQENHRQKALKD